MLAQPAMGDASSRAGAWLRAKSCKVGTSFAKVQYASQCSAALALYVSLPLARACCLVCAFWLFVAEFKFKLLVKEVAFPSPRAHT
jgi:hypothetical protein